LIFGLRDSQFFRCSSWIDRDEFQLLAIHDLSAHFFQGALGYGSVAAGLSLLAYTLFTLVVPPIAERLAHKYQPGIVIPAGMFTIGLGFILMKFGCRVDPANGLTMLSGCLLAGIGLGLTNTTVTNTTTGLRLRAQFRALAQAWS
jgi:hypothetical protein